MTIIITKDYGVSMPRGNLLGCVGEHLLRTVTVVHPKFENARYIMKFLYSDNVCYEKEITNGILTLDGSLLRIGGNVKMQFFAYAKDTNDENSSQKIFESEIRLFSPKVVVMFTSNSWAADLLKYMNNNQEPICIEQLNWDKYKCDVYRINETYFVVSEHPQGKKEEIHAESIISFIKSIQNLQGINRYC